MCSSVGQLKRRQASSGGSNPYGDAVSLAFLDAYNAGITWLGRPGRLDWNAGSPIAAT